MMRSPKAIARSGAAGAVGGGMPSHAFLLSAFLPVLAAVASILLETDLGSWGLLIWLAGLVPVFLLTRYLGWPGALVGLSWTTAMVVLSELFVALLAGRPPDWSLVGVVVAVTASAALGTGLERQWWLHRLGAGTEVREGGKRPADELPSGEILDYFLRKLFAAARRRPPLSVVLLEVDRFEEHTEMYGEEKARRSMEVAVEALRHQTRASNVFGSVDRKTLLVLLNDEGLAAAHAFATRVLEEVAAANAPWPGRITLSAGIAGFEPSLTSAEALLANARQALDTARRMSGGIPVIFRGPVDETLVTAGMVVLEPNGQVKEIRGAL